MPATNWEGICEEMGWNDESQMLHLAAFITKKGLWSEFEEYARKVADEENAEAASGDPDA